MSTPYSSMKEVVLYMWTHVLQLEWLLIYRIHSFKYSLVDSLFMFYFSFLQSDQPKTKEEL